MRLITTLLCAGTVAVSSAQELFLPKSSPLEIYPIGFQNTNGVEGERERTLRDLQFKCQYMAGLNFYNLQNLALKNPYYTFKSGSNSVVVSFCNDIEKDTLTALGCDPNMQTMAVLVNAAGTECNRLSGSNPTTNANFNVQNQDENDGLQIVYSGGDDGFGLTVNIQCSPGENVFSDPNLDLTTQSNIIATFSSSTGCKNGQLSAIWEWFKSNRWVMFGVFLGIGTIICFFGRKLFKPVLFLTGIIMASSLVMLLFYSTFLKSNTKAWVGWVVLVSSLILGLLLGWLFVKIARLGAFCLAAWGGYALSLLIYNAFMYKMDSDVGFWCFTIGTALVFGILALCFFDHILIHATALLGSFLAVYGIGLVAGRYTNPFTIVELIKHGQIDSVDPVFYAYLAGNLIMYVMGAGWQYRHRRNNPDEDPYNLKGRYGRGRY